MLAFFLDVLYLLPADCLLEFAGSGRQILVSLRLNEHSLEDFDSLSHARVQRSLDRVEVIVKVLPEADQERERLVQPVFQVSGEKGETDHSVRISHLCRFWEKRRYLVREFQIVIHY